MPRKSFRTAATAMLAIPSTSSGARTPRSASPFPMSVSMTLPATLRAVPPQPPSCRSSPGNANDDDDDHSIINLQPLSTTPSLRPESLPHPPVALDREDWKQLLKSKQNYEMLRKAIRFLHDNRAVSSKHPNTARRLRQINAELRENRSHHVLKFILNAVFLAIGLLLLLSVLAAIGYTSTGQY